MGEPDGAREDRRHCWLPGGDLCECSSAVEQSWNGQVRWEGTHKYCESDNSLVRDGEWRFYPEDDGQLGMIEVYKDGKLHGRNWSYRKNGQLATKVWYKDGEYHGPYEWYDEQGELGTKGTFNMGEPCGEWQQCRPWPDHEELETKIYPPCDPGLEGED